MGSAEGGARRRRGNRPITRRRVLRWGTLGLGAVVTGCRGVVVDDVETLSTAYPDVATRIARAAPPTRTPVPTANPPSARDLGFDTDVAVTPTEAFYQVEYGAVPRAIAEDAYTLEVDGLVDRPLTLRLADLKAMPQQTIMRTLQCISNPAGGDLIGNAAWRGVRMGDVLDAAGAGGEGVELKLTSRDGYHTGVKTQVAADPASLLALEMNGAPLPVAHGQPVRCLFPGKYGQKQPKWLAGITVQSARHVGHWESQGWSDAAPIQVSSRIDVPPTGATVAPGAGRRTHHGFHTPGTGQGVAPGGRAGVLFAGVAFSDRSGVQAVEILIDDRPLGEARLLKAPAPYTDTVWTQWSWRWQQPVPGNHTLMARARDGNGIAQHRPRQGLLEGTKPNGTSEMHRIRFFVPEAPA